MSKLNETQKGMALEDIQKLAADLYDFILDEKYKTASEDEIYNDLMAVMLPEEVKALGGIDKIKAAIRRSRVLDPIPGVPGPVRRINAVQAFNTPLELAHIRNMK